jgi:hypothetical protein
MKGSAALLPNNNHVVIVNEGNYQQPHNQCENLLPELGFEEGEIDIFEEYQESENDIVERYLQIARSPPYNLDWQTSHDACLADDALGVFKPHGGEYTKHDIAKDAFNLFSQQLFPQEAPVQGGRKKKSKRSTKKRVNKRKRSTRRRKYRRSRK